MKKQAWIILLIMLLVLAFVFFNFTEKTEPIEETSQKILGYCSTMQPEALELAEKENYTLRKFVSAGDAMSAFKRGQVDVALIGRRAYSEELDPKVEEIVLEDGITIVSNRRLALDYSNLVNLEIHTYLDETNLGLRNLIIHQDKEAVFQKINQGKLALISFEDWRDDFGLVIIMNGTERAREFRGAFLYKNQDL